MRRRLRSALALAAVGFVSAGCSGAGPTPPTLTAGGSTSSPTATSAPSPDASAPTASPSVSAAAPSGRTVGAEHPGPASDRTAAGKVLTRFLGGLDAAAAAKSSAALEPLFTASCLWCADQTKSIDRAAFLGGSRIGGAVSGISIKYRGVGKQKQLVFDVTMSVSAMKVVDRDAHEQLSAPAVSRGQFTFGVADSGGAWIVVDGSQGRTLL